ncbi:beta-galactosidase 17 isoform X2 [Impatiens glandulifera]|uniref:beta-galactosidase 17 isoform X2 n=1 Tax=Impatiens glandulifera TaxID=253017 RepID=UPI001FB09C9D|nr:beta-galactosidase 17 isoform X2 [Impatiens glandulifera]
MRIGAGLNLKSKGGQPAIFTGDRSLAMARRRGIRTTTAIFFFFFLSIVAVGTFSLAFSPLPSLTSHSPSRLSSKLVPKEKLLLDDKVNVQKFEIADDKFWKDEKPFQIIGGDLHYFRVLPEYWEDRLLKAKALGLNTIQTYVPWNLHEPKKGQLLFKGIADIVSFLKLCQKLDLLVMLRPGPYICAEWDLGGFPAWLLAKEPPLRLRSSDPAFLKLVESWWGTLFTLVAPLLYDNGGPIIMVQIENEFGSYGDDQDYLHYLVKLARGYLGNNTILYTTDGGARENLEKGTIRGDAVFSAVDFTTGDNPWPIFKLQKEFNAPGKSPPLSAEFYTGWLTHWGEKIATTDARSTAAALEEILSRNASAVLYMAHGGTNFGFYSGANTDANNESAYKPDLTSYDYDAPIKEFGDVDNAKFKELQKVISRYTKKSIPPLPADIGKMGYGRIKLHKTAFLLDILNTTNTIVAVKSESPNSMESVGQNSGIVLYASEYDPSPKGNYLSIPKVHDRGQVFILCPEKYPERRTYVGTIERWSNNDLYIPHTQCPSKVTLYILVENMGRVNYGAYIFDRKGILSSVYLDGKELNGWKMTPVPLPNLNDMLNFDHILPVLHSRIIQSFKHNSGNFTKEPAFYSGRFTIIKKDQVKDTFLSFRGWGKGIVFVNDFNLGRFWPSLGPQCNLYLPAPILKHGENTVVILELESASSELTITSVDQPDFTCGSSRIGGVRIASL